MEFKLYILEEDGIPVCLDASYLNANNVTEEELTESVKKGLTVATIVLSSLEGGKQMDARSESMKTTIEGRFYLDTSEFTCRRAVEYIQSWLPAWGPVCVEGFRRLHPSIQMCIDSNIERVLNPSFVMNEDFIKLLNRKRNGSGAETK
jgi:hypothetical protein